MGYWDSTDLSKLPFLSLIKKHPQVGDPSPEFLKAIDIKKSFSNKPIIVAEIGVGFGASALAACIKLSEQDTYYCFDFESSVNALLEDLSRVQNIKCKRLGFGNTPRNLDSYNWNLSKLVLDMIKENRDGIFDVAYLDGAHDFARDGLAVCLLKKLVKPTGFLVLDDVMSRLTTWASPNYIDINFTREQAEDQQILRAQNIFLIGDSNFEQLTEPDSYRSVFRRIK